MCLSSLSLTQCSLRISSIEIMASFSKYAEAEMSASYNKRNKTNALDPMLQVVHEKQSITAYRNTAYYSLGPLFPNQERKAK